MRIRVRLIDYSGPGYDTLPPEMLLKIFQECVSEEKRKSVVLNYLGKICRYWTAVLSYPQFYEEIDNASLHTEDILFLCRKKWTTHTACVFLSMPQDCVRRRNVELLLHHLPKLEELAVTLSDFSSTVVRFFNELEKHDYPVYELCFSDGRRRIFPHMFYGYLHNNGLNIGSISLSNCRVSNVLLLLNTIADFCPNLRRIEIEDVRGDNVIFPVTKFQMKCPQLRVIILKQLRVICLMQFRFAVDESVEIGFPLLEEFMCRRSAALTDQVLLSILRTSHHLTYLDVTSTPVTVQGLLAIPPENLNYIWLKNTDARLHGDYMQVWQRWQHSLRCSVT